MNSKLIQTKGKIYTILQNKSFTKNECIIIIIFYSKILQQNLQLLQWIMVIGKVTLSVLIDRKCCLWHKNWIQQVFCTSYTVQDEYLSCEILSAKNILFCRELSTLLSVLAKDFQLPCIFHLETSIPLLVKTVAEVRRQQWPAYLVGPIILDYRQFSRTNFQFCPLILPEQSSFHFDNLKINLKTLHGLAEV